MSFWAEFLGGKRTKRSTCSIVKGQECNLPLWPTRFTLWLEKKGWAESCLPIGFCRIYGIRVTRKKSCPACHEAGKGKRDETIISCDSWHPWQSGFYPGGLGSGEADGGLRLHRRRHVACHCRAEKGNLWQKRSRCHLYLHRRRDEGSDRDDLWRGPFAPGGRHGGDQCRSGWGRRRDGVEPGARRLFGPA